MSELYSTTTVDPFDCIYLQVTFSAYKIADSDVTI